MSSVKPPEFFFDRSLGKVTARRLREAGYTVHLIADFYPADASEVLDEIWIAEGCARGWALLSKDRRIRYRTSELEALQGGHLFCLSSGNMDIEEMTQAFLCAMPSIVNALTTQAIGFWHVHRNGDIRRMWP